MYRKHRHHPYLPRTLTPPLITHASTQPPSTYFTQPTSLHLTHSPLQHHQNVQAIRQVPSNSVQADQYALSTPTDAETLLATRPHNETQQREIQDSQQDQDQEPTFTVQTQGVKAEPLLRKGRWSPGEDGRLLGCIDVYGPNKWKQVAREVGTRTGDQCWKRWNDSLDPTLKHDQWTQEEDAILEAAVSQIGRSWSKIATEKLNGRSGLACKNRMDHLNRKRRRTMNIQGGQYFPRRSKLSRADMKAAQMEQLAHNLVHSDPMHRDPMHPLELVGHQQPLMQFGNGNFEDFSSSHRNHEYYFPSNKVNELDVLSWKDGNRNILLQNQTPTPSPVWWNGNSKDMGRNGLSRQPAPIQNGNNGLWNATNVSNPYNGPSLQALAPSMNSPADIVSSNGNVADISANTHPSNQDFNHGQGFNVNPYNPHPLPGYSNVASYSMYDFRPQGPNFSSSYATSQHSSSSVTSSPESEASSSSMHVHDFVPPHPLNISVLTSPSNIPTTMAPQKHSHYTISQDDINAAYYSSASPQTSIPSFCGPQLAVADDRLTSAHFIHENQAHFTMQGHEIENADAADVTNGSMIDTHLNLNSFEGSHHDVDNKDTNASWYPAPQEML